MISMKTKITLALLLAGNLTLFSQVLSYSDQAVLFSSEDMLGTARYMGMSGAFGALGNDLTSIEINPAAVADQPATVSSVRTITGE